MLRTINLHNAPVCVNRADRRRCSFLAKGVEERNIRAVTDGSGTVLRTNHYDPNE